MRIVAPPRTGVWRVGRGDDPLAAPPPDPMPLDDSRAGNRFDSMLGDYGVVYFGTTLEVCYGETLSRFRPDPLLVFIEDEWHKLGFMERGAVPADWRSRRTAVRARVGATGRFLDVEDHETREWLLSHANFGAVVRMWGHRDLDVSVIRGPDRRVTRLISQFVYSMVDQHDEPVFDGIRYLSRTNTDWECWAAFDRAPIEECERLPILATDEVLQQVAKGYGLTIH